MGELENRLREARDRNAARQSETAELADHEDAAAADARSRAMALLPDLERAIRALRDTKPVGQFASRKPKGWYQAGFGVIPLKGPPHPPIVDEWLKRGTWTESATADGGTVHLDAGELVSRLLDWVVERLVETEKRTAG